MNNEKIEIEVSPDEFLKTMRNMKDNGFDILHSITGVDYIEYFQVVYHLFSITYPEKSAVIKVNIPKEEPSLPSVSNIWQTADWQERECYDLVGIKFTNHPNLRRILLPDDWIGHTLQKNYKKQTPDLEIKY